MIYTYMQELMPRERFQLQSVPKKTLRLRVYIYWKIVLDVVSIENNIY